MRPAFRRVLAALALLGLAAACSPQQEEAARPAPFALTDEAMGRYCGMNVLEHEGPKGQVILKGALEPIWFSSARDVVAFTLLPEEPKTYAALYVSDMAVAPSWAEPGAKNWIEARDAWFVIGSTRRGGMGVAETVPFSTEKAAQDFAAAHGGAVVRFDKIPAAYVLGDAGPPDAAPHTPHDQHRH